MGLAFSNNGLYNSEIGFNMFVVVLFWMIREVRVLNCNLIDEIRALVVVICLGMLIC